MEKQLKIILATDYSEAVMNAERYAIQFAEKTDSFLTIIHVYDIPFNFPAAHSEYAKATEELRLHELQRLTQHCERLMDSMDIRLNEDNFECVVLEGSVGKQIRKEAVLSHTDIIITGTHEANGFQKLFLGSHTWDVIKKSEIPVLAIPNDAIFSTLKNIVFATEYREGEIPGIHFLVELAKQFDAELTVLHITNYILSKEFEKTLFGKFRTEVQDKISYNKLNLCLVQYDDIVGGLSNYCENSKTDWLVMSPSKPFFFEKIFTPKKSITKEMTFQTHIPLLAVPDFYIPENVFSEQSTKTL